MPLLEATGFQACMQANIRKAPRWPHLPPELMEQGLVCVVKVYHRPHEVGDLQGRFGG